MAAEKLGIRTLWLFMAPVQVTEWALQRKMRDAMYRVVLGNDINRLRSDSGMPPVEDWDSWLQYSERSIGQWPTWFAPPEDSWLPGVNPTGFLIGQPGDDGVLPAEVLDYLDAVGRKPLLITGGTGRYLNETFYSVCIDAAQSLDVPAIVVTRDQDLLPKRLPDDLFLAQRLPFAALMPRCSAVIHHGGLGTIGTAAAAGIPQVILASGADRPDNGVRVESLGIGKSYLLAQSSADCLVEALAALEQPDVHSRCNEAARRILGHNAADSACRVVEQFAAEAARGS
jgi:UDP:flavonoid glycosyltransferase YjiC (YdhE family)